MKRFFFTIVIILAAAAAASAQSRSAGLRIGATGLDAVYQHNISKDRFIEGNIGFDFGVKNNSGFKVTGIYNIVWARPAWTATGSWAIYAGPGVSLGYVYDMVGYEFMEMEADYPDNGFMLALTGQVGIEYSFDFPLQLALDIRPMIGLHINDGRFRVPNTSETVEFESKTGFYGNGLSGFIPTLSVRYRF